MQKEAKKISLVNPTPLEAGSILAERHGDKVTSTQSISAALLLYLEWPKYRLSHIETGDNTALAPCAISADPDETEPTELYIRLDKTKSLRRWEINSITAVQFEVFNVAYRFTTRCLAIDETATELILVVAVPDVLEVHKKRAIPRFKVNAENNRVWASIQWATTATKKISLIPFEASLNSMVASSKNAIDTTQRKGSVFIGDIEIPAEISLIAGDAYLLHLNMGDPHLFGKYFDLFTAVAFSTLKPRNLVNSDMLYETYKSTGFFDKYVNTNDEAEAQRYKTNLINTWNAISEDRNIHSIDYVSVDSSSGAPIGASSLINAFKNGAKDVWIMTQLCTKAEPQFFDNTRNLYLWRIAYLCALPGDFDISCWIDGNSRFLERMWIKFIRQLGRVNDTYWPVTIRVYSPRVRQSDDAIAVTKASFGTLERTYLLEDGVIGAVDPTYINFGKLLDHVASVPPSKLSFGELSTRAELLASKSSTKDLGIRITLPAENEDTDAKALPSILLNRFCYFGKQDAPFLYSSILHSLAVMERKYTPGDD